MTDTTRTLTLQLNSDITYLSGTVNGVSCTWSRIGSGQWQTTAARADDDVYVIAVTAVSSSGLSYNLATTIYYGLHLITDRTTADVQRVKDLTDKITAGTATEAERTEYLVNPKGAYNACDLNRVGAAIYYVADILTAQGYRVVPTVKTNWIASDMFYQSDLAEYLDNISALRTALAVWQSTPGVPSCVTTYHNANDIEKIIEDVDILVNNMIAGYKFSDTFYCGE